MKKFYLQHEFIFIHEADNILFSFFLFESSGLRCGQTKKTLIDEKKQFQFFHCGSRDKQSLIKSKVKLRFLILSSRILTIEALYSVSTAFGVLVTNLDAPFYFLSQPLAHFVSIVTFASVPSLSPSHFPLSSFLPSFPPSLPP